MRTPIVLLALILAGGAVSSARAAELTAEQKALLQMAGGQGKKANKKEEAVRGTFGEYLSSLQSKVTITGYGSLRLNKKTDDSALKFDQHYFVMQISTQLSDWIFVEAEIEYEHNGGEISLEYAMIDFQIRSWLLVRAGLMLVPFGQFNETIHPAFRNRMALRPLAYRSTFPATYADAGIQLRGIFKLRSHRLGYMVYVINGLQAADDPNTKNVDEALVGGGGIREMRSRTLNRKTSMRAFGGRLWGKLALGATSYLQGGGSVYAAPYTNDGESWLTILGADLVLTHNALEISSAWVSAFEQRNNAKTFKKNGFFLQAAYTLFGHIQPAVRFDLQLFPGKKDDFWMLVPALNVLIRDNVLVKANYYIKRHIKSGFEDVDEFIAELAFAF